MTCSWWLWVFCLPGGNKTKTKQQLLVPAAYVKSGVVSSLVTVCEHPMPRFPFMPQKELQYLVLQAVQLVGKPSRLVLQEVFYNPEIPTFSLPAILFPTIGRFLRSLFSISFNNIFFNCLIFNPGAYSEGFISTCVWEEVEPQLVIKYAATRMANGTSLFIWFRVTRLSSGFSK